MARRAKYTNERKISSIVLNLTSKPRKSIGMIVKSNIKRLEKNQQEHLQRVDGMVSNINEPDEVAAYIADVKEKSTLVELSVQFHRQILSTAKSILTNSNVCTKSNLYLQFQRIY